MEEDDRKEIEEEQRRQQPLDRHVMQTNHCGDVVENSSNFQEGNTKSFPETLYGILSMPEYSTMIQWLPHGNGWIITDKKAFTNEVLPKYFEGAKFTSFTRRLKRWNFERVLEGPELGAYYNSYFVMDKPELMQHLMPWIMILCCII